MDQSDIDALMNDSPDPEGDAAGGAAQDFSGGLSQADIDAAMAGETPAEPVAEEATAPPGEDDIGFSQADIDALMNSARAPADEAPAPAAASADPDGMGFNQNDIDALLSGLAEPAPAPAPAPAKAPVGLDSEGRPLDALGAAMAAAIAEEKAAAEAAGAAAQLPVSELELPEFDSDELISEATQPISLLHDVELHVKIELGRTHMFIEDVLRLGEGSVVELDRLAGDPVDVYVNGRLVARGEVLVLNDNFCVRVSEIISDSNARLAG